MTETKKQRAAGRRARKEQKQRQVLALLMGLGGILLLFAAFLALRPRSGAETREAGAGSTGASVLLVDRESVDLGDIRVDQMAEVSFKITNTGASPVSFLEPPYIEVREGC